MHHKLGIDHIKIAQGIHTAFGMVNSLILKSPDHMANRIHVGYVFKYISFGNGLSLHFGQKHQIKTRLDLFFGGIHPH